EHVVEHHGGRVPSELDQLLALPGIGTYTARAVAVFAFGQRHPVVDTNVRRVVARAVGGGQAAGPPTPAADRVAGEALLPADRARAAKTSIALMELGALVCTARQPHCSDCPLWSRCAWRRAGAPPATGPTRRTQKYAGTDRQVRGILLGALRDATAAVPRATLDLLWHDPVQ